MSGPPQAEVPLDGGRQSGPHAGAGEADGVTLELTF